MSRLQLLRWAEEALNIFLDVQADKTALLGQLLRLSV
jgi:hypothetical protein